MPTNHPTDTLNSRYAGTIGELSFGRLRASAMSASMPEIPREDPLKLNGVAKKLHDGLINFFSAHSISSAPLTSYAKKEHQELLRNFKQALNYLKAFKPSNTDARLAGVTAHCDLTTLAALISAHSSSPKNNNLYAPLLSAHYQGGKLSNAVLGHLECVERATPREAWLGSALKELDNLIKIVENVLEKVADYRAVREGRPGPGTPAERTRRQKQWGTFIKPLQKRLEELNSTNANDKTKNLRRAIIEGAPSECRAAHLIEVLPQHAEGLKPQRFEECLAAFYRCLMETKKSLELPR